MIAKRAVLSGLVLALFIGGCTADTPAPPAPSSSTMSPPPEPATPLPGSTPPDTRLKFGEKAVITVGPSDDQARVGVIVTAVEKAPPQDMAALRTFPGVNRWAYFVRVILVNEEGDGSWSGYSGPILHDDSGSQFILGSDLYLPHCTWRTSPPGEWDAKGDRFETCRIIFSDADSVYVNVPGGNIYWDR